MSDCGLKSNILRSQVLIKPNPKSAIRNWGLVRLNRNIAEGIIRRVKQGLKSAFAERMMKRFFFPSVAILWVGIAALGAQEKIPTIVFDSQIKDFGKVLEGEELKHVFKFTNNGSATLEILKVEPS